MLPDTHVLHTLHVYCWTYWTAYQCPLQEEPTTPCHAQIPPEDGGAPLPRQQQPPAYLAAGSATPHHLSMRTPMHGWVRAPVVASTWVVLSVSIFGLRQTASFCPASPACTLWFAWTAASSALAQALQGVQHRPVANAESGL